MAGVERYLFDRGFDAVGTATNADAPAPEPVFSESDLQQAQAEGYARGRAEAAAEQDAHRAAERLRQAALETIAAELAALAERFDAVTEAAGTDAVRIALAVSRKLLPACWRDAAAAEIESLVRTTLAGLTDEPAVVVHIAPTLLEELAPRLQRMVVGGDPGRLRVSGDPALSEGDCRIDWRGGGLVRDQRTLWRDIELLVEQTVGVAALPAPAAEAAITIGQDHG